MTTVKNIYDAIDAIAPFATALSYDNVGILIGNATAGISRALIALDITGAVVQEAERAGADLIISHHPVIFNPLKRLNTGTVPYDMAVLGINGLCCHTNLDIAEHFGVNVALAQALGLKNIEKLGDVLLVGRVEAVKSDVFAAYVKTALLAEKIAYTKSGRQIQKVAVCAGSGGEYITEALGSCDAFVTGEAHHHELLYAAEHDLPIFVAGHYETEKPFGLRLKAYLEEQFKDVSFILSKDEVNPVVSI